MGFAPRSSTEPRPVRKKKPDELLSSVVRETATPAAIEMLRDNTAFVFPSGTAWAVLLLRVEAIGGLSRRNSRDEAKGSLIELIESDQIRTVATAEMLEAEVVGIIPTVDTLDRMSEFSLLADRPADQPALYSLAVFWQDEDNDLVIEVCGPASLAQVTAVAGGDLSLRDIVDARTWTENGGGRRVLTEGSQAGTAEWQVATTEMDVVADGPDESIEPTTNVYQGAPMESDEAVAMDTEEPELSFGGEGSIDTEVIGETDIDEAPLYVDDVDGDNELVDDEFEGIGGEERFDSPTDTADDPKGPADPEDDRVVSESEVQTSIARRFLSTGQELTIDLDQFRTAFSIGAPVTAIQAPAGTDGWLGDQINQMSSQANAGLEQLRQHHEQELQSLYVGLMSQHIERVSQDIKTMFTPLEASAKAAHEARRAEVASRVERLRDELDTAFRQGMEAESERAAAEAASRYRAHNTKRHNRDLLEARNSVERGVEAEYEHDQRRLEAARAAAMQQGLEFGQTRVDEVVRDEQTAHLAAEQQLMQEWNTSILKVIDEHRKDDIARVNVLAEQQARDNAIATLQAEQAEALRALKDQHTQRIALMEDSLSRSRQDAADRISFRETQWQDVLDTEKSRAEAESASARSLREQMAQMEVSFQRRYDARVEELEADKHRQIDEMQQVSTAQHRMIRALTVLVVVLTLVMLLAAGFIIRLQF